MQLNSSRPQPLIKTDEAYIKLMEVTWRDGSSKASLLLRVHRRIDDCAAQGHRQADLGNGGGGWHVDHQVRSAFH